jgi:two-component system nitrate/nitrite response regulator NarL
MTNRQVGVLIADDHPVVRMGLRNLFQSDPEFRVVGEAADGQHALDLAYRLKPDLLLLDVAMPGLSGMEVLRQLFAAGASTRIILVTATIDRQRLAQALQFGARGVVLKDTSPPHMFQAVRAVMNGQYWIGPQGVTDLVEALRQSLDEKPDPSKNFGLTSREMQVIAAIGEGCTNKDIAEKFAISEETVKRHLTNIFNKLGVFSRLELGMFAVNHHLLESAAR